MNTVEFKREDEGMREKQVSREKKEVNKQARQSVWQTQVLLFDSASLDPSYNDGSRDVFKESPHPTRLPESSWLFSAGLIFELPL